MLDDLPTPAETTAMYRQAEIARAESAILGCDRFLSDTMYAADHEKIREKRGWWVAYLQQLKRKLEGK